MTIQRLAALRALGVPDEQVSAELGWSIETIKLLASSDAFKALEREEVIRGNVGGHDG